MNSRAKEFDYIPLLQDSRSTSRYEHRDGSGRVPQVVGNLHAGSHERSVYPTLPHAVFDRFSEIYSGMIMDMLWPEIKNAIEELSYGKGVRISRACGVDPNEISLEIGLR